MKLRIFLVLIIAGLLLCGCETFHGLGKDVEKLGQGVEKAGEWVQEKAQ